MCGIAGIVNNAQPVDQGLLKAMCDSMVHRGPDEEGFYLTQGVGLGMRRLKIIDLETGSQPIFNEDRSVAVVFNGEIYNFQSLRSDLLKKGHRFSTQTDTEVIVHLYEEFGEEFLQYLNGMFAIALWDCVKRRLVLARDRMGEKPLHYMETPTGLVFASEIKSVLLGCHSKPEMDREAVYHYFTFHYIPAPHTVFQGIRKLLPASYLIYQDGRVTVKKYWGFSYKPDFQKSEEQFSEELRTLLREAVRIRLISDVPLGAFLSGGIDSSIVVGLMSSLMNRPVKTFSMGFDVEQHDELEYARLVARHFHTDHHELVVKPSAIDLVQRLVRFFDEPFGDSSAIPTFLLSEMTRQHVTVALSGDGGDELFGGYERYRRIMNRRWIADLPFSLREFLAHRVGNFLPRLARGKAFLQSLTLENDRFYSVGLSEQRKKRIFSQDFLESIECLDSFDIMRPHLLGAEIEVLSRYQYLDSMVYLPDDILVKVDRMSMANSLEGRMPFLDHHIVEFAATIPAALKIRKNRTKYLLKQSMKSILPPKILRRGKHGFTLPVDHWFRNELRSLLVEILSGENLKRIGIFNGGYIGQLVDDHIHNRKNHKELLWSLLMFELWHDSFYGGHKVWAGSGSTTCSTR